MDELRANPFAPRICELFSEDGSGSLTFANFLDMKGAFSRKARPEVRTIWAFALWDFDGDDMIGVSDVKCGVDLITNSTTYINETALPLKEGDLLEMLDPYQLEEVRSGPELGETRKCAWGLDPLYYHSRATRRMRDTHNARTLPTHSHTHSLTQPPFQSFRFARSQSRSSSSSTPAAWASPSSPSKPPWIACPTFSSTSGCRIEPHRELLRKPGHQAM